MTKPDDKNPFETIGERQARKEKRAHEYRVANIKAEKDERDEQTQFKLYRRAHRAQLTALLNDPRIGDKVGALMKLLKTMGPDSAATLVDYIEKSEWLKCADDDVRAECLSRIASAIMRVRETHGLPPFEDSLGNLFDGDTNQDPPTAFEKIRKMLA